MYSQNNFAGDIKYISGKNTNQISAPMPCWGNPSSTVTSLLVFLTEALIVSLSSGLIERKLITCINKISYFCHQTWKCYKLYGLDCPSNGLPQRWFLPLQVSQQPVKQTTLWFQMEGEMFCPWHVLYIKTWHREFSKQMASYQNGKHIPFCTTK